MNKKFVLIFLAGWALAIVLPPARVMAMFKSK